MRGYIYKSKRNKRELGYDNPYVTVHYLRTIKRQFLHDRYFCEMKFPRLLLLLQLKFV